MSNPLAAAIPEITIHNNRAITTSIAVANYFEKSHDNVLKKIRAVVLNCPQSYHVVNFNEVVREVPGGDGAVRKMPMFELTRDAFALIVMGFTGKKALRWKIDYINAFNKMEAELSKPVAQPGYSELVITLQNWQPVCSRVGQPGEFMSTLEGHTEMLRRAGYVITHCDDLELLTVADLAKRADEARQLMNKWMAITNS